MSQILILSSRQANRRLLFRHLGPLHDVRLGLNDLSDTRPDLIIVDQAELERLHSQIRTLKSQEADAPLPVILMRARNAAETEPGIDVVDGVLEVPVSKDYLDTTVAKALAYRHRLKEKARQISSLTKQSSQLENQVESVNDQLKRALVETTLALTRAAEYKDSDTGEHIQRMGYYTRTLAEALRLDEEFQDRIFHASPMHDIGKIAVPEEILLKNGRLDAGEWETMECHTIWGRDVLSGSESPYLVLGAEIAEYHHEKWNGGGYPHGIGGEAIPIGARILSVCDVYDALRSKRPYKKPFSHEAASRIVVEGDDRTSLPGERRRPSHSTRQP